MCMQKLTDITPEGFYSHNTDEEHSARVMGDEVYINRLRLNNGLPPIDGLDVFDYAFNNDGYVILHKNLGPEEPEGALPELSGYVLARRKNSQYGYSYAIDDLLVDESHRGHGLGKFLVGKLASKGSYVMRTAAMTYPSMVTIDPEKLSENTYGWFLSRGFRNNGLELGLELPGTVFHDVPSEDFKRFEAKMPLEWSGSIEEVSIDGEESKIHVYRDATHVGCVQQVPIDYEEGDETKPEGMKFRVMPDDGPEFDGYYSYEFFAIVDLLEQRVS